MSKEKPLKEYTAAEFLAKIKTLANKLPFTQEKYLVNYAINQISNLLVKEDVLKRTVGEASPEIQNLLQTLPLEKSLSSFHDRLNEIYEVLDKEISLKGYTLEELSTEIDALIAQQPENLETQLDRFQKELLLRQLQLEMVAPQPSNYQESKETIEQYLEKILEVTKTTPIEEVEEPAGNSAWYDISKKQCTTYVEVLTTPRNPPKDIKPQKSYEDTISRRQSSADIASYWGF